MTLPAIAVNNIPIYTALIAGGFAIFGAVIGSLTTTYFSHISQLKISRRMQRHQAYAEIMGKKALLMQLMVSRFEAYIFSDYHEYLWAISGYPKDSIDFNEAARWMHKSEDLALEVAKTKQSLFESIGLVKMVFTNTTELNRLTEAIYHFGTPQISPPSNAKDRTEVNKWKINAVASLQKLVETQYGKPIDDLLGILEEETHL